MFQVSESKKEVLRKLTERDWTPTDLAEELGKSTETVYNHLRELEEMGVLSKSKVTAKTRPKTSYSINKGFIQFIAVLPGSFEVNTLEVNEDRAALFRIWSLPQKRFHPFLKELWGQIRGREEVKAVAVYGSVARGQADEDSDIDLLLIVEGNKEEVKDEFGSLVLKTKKGKELAMSQIYTEEEYNKSKGSDFLEDIREELHVIYDPERIL